jgi:hypothetical protein
MITMVTSWPDVLVVGINLAALCFIVWIINRPTKP